VIIDGDSHIVEPRTMWREYCDPCGRRCHRRLPDPAPAMSYMASDDSSFITEIILSPAITAQRSSAVLCSPMQRRLPELKVVSSKDRRPAEHTHRLNSAAAGWSR
jgi:hypothetical protein